MSKQVTVFAIIDAADEHAAQIRAAVMNLAHQSAAEPGCLRYDVHSSGKASLRLILHEIWADEAAVERHRGSAHVAAFKTALHGSSAQVWASPFHLLTEDP